MFGGYSRYRRAGVFGALAGRSRTRGVFRGPIARAPALDGWRDGLARAEAGARNRPHDHAAPAGRRLRRVAAQRSPGQARPLPDGPQPRGPHALPRPGRRRLRLPPARPRQGARADGQVAAARRGWPSNVAAAEPFARKSGFNPPVGAWIAARADRLGGLVAAQPGVAEFLPAGAVRAVIADAAANSQAAWSLVFYALWHTHHVLGLPADGPIDEVLAAAARGRVTRNRGHVRLNPRRRRLFAAQASRTCPNFPRPVSADRAAQPSACGPSSARARRSRPRRQAGGR